MARPPPRPSFDASTPLEKSGLAPRRHHLRVSNGGPALVKERLETFAAAFLSDPRPGLVFEYDRLVFANDAARGLLGAAPSAATDEFLACLKASLNRGRLEPGLRLQTRSGVYAPVLQPPRIRRGLSTVICFLVQQCTVDPAVQCLSKRQRCVVQLLAKGLSNRQIADELGISIETVRTHVAHALERTGTKTRTGLVGRVLER
jgi:DNA-binding CsgD family transcriptional regulator